jgi:hypothetical protein
LTCGKEAEAIDDSLLMKIVIAVLVPHALAAGPAVVRATATGRPQWLRLPQVIVG